MNSCPFVEGQDAVVAAVIDNNAVAVDDVDLAADCDDDCQYIFPQRLMSILSDEKNHDAICWLPHGRAFIIRNRTIFAEKVMPRFFPRKSKYSSFTRKLNRWNFVRVSSGPELGAYYHEFFLRDKPHLAAQMFCKNLRTKIAMADSKPSPTTVIAESNNCEQPRSTVLPAVSPIQTSVKVADAATDLYLRNQPMDPAMQYLLKQQLNFCQQQSHHSSTMAQNDHLQPQPQRKHFNPQQMFNQQHQHRPPILAYGDGTYQVPASYSRGDMNNVAPFNNSSNNYNNNNNHNNAGGNNNMNLWQQIQAQKEQEARMMQLRQLMTLNLQKQQNRGKSPAKNFRASAA